ncbi:MAG: hypothetical protein ACOYXW_05005 [Actinomycetota bacterium]
MTAVALGVVAERRQLLRITEDLVREFHPTRSAGAVIRTVVQCRDELVRCGVRAGLSVAAEEMARRRLSG